MLVRRETDLDDAAIFALHNAAFGAGGDVVTAEAQLVRDLRANGDIIDALSLVAELDGAVVGHVVGSRAHLDGRPSLGIGPLGVLPEYQRRGVGSALMHAVIAAADALDEPAAVLLGDPRYYQRFGFRLAQPLGVFPPDPRWARHFQIRKLTTWTHRTRGAFCYAPAFDNV